MAKIATVGDLRKALEGREDEESFVIDLEENTPSGIIKRYGECVGLGSSGGGRITVMWIDLKSEGLNYAI